MTEKIEGLQICKCIDMDCLPNKAFLTNDEGQSVQALICPVCGGQIETTEEVD